MRLQVCHAPAGQNIPNPREPLLAECPLWADFVAPPHNGFSLLIRWIRSRRPQSTFGRPYPAGDHPAVASRTGEPAEPADNKASHIL
jgi:hypothetical protein